MDKIKVIYDRKGNTLNVWFDDPKLEFSCEETGDEVILVKDKRGRIIGFEKLNYLKQPSDLKELEVESYVR
ncbi:DUF2283 domain-containing protein [Candidatus Acetothermia bacterium]|nr:DUF2283 domain-containing protein [Candidatus Acetothermia bacterium]MBI3459670.1 DUF2283 domain-containing protein [Candidatus Acetothermia bacterium]MBI3660026.1 DUF2283 domain-containing protein [Candidatus Acetothermia bacterium]